ncbi:MAG: aldo/keto reductase [Anaerolineaceae bacterium]|nr:aldo/keto reductase [Anaerolineaceae bacterium]
MNYRHLGKSGLKISALSLGSWVTYHNQVDVEKAKTLLKTAFDLGVNFFDNAEGYMKGKSEEIMGEALLQLGIPREQYLISTKVFRGGDTPNEQGLSRKHIIEAVNRSLKRFHTDRIDLVYAHAQDKDCPIEETVWAFNEVIRQGKAFYWGTSNWNGKDIAQATAIAEAHGWLPPSMEQAEYNLLQRQRVEKEFLPLYEHPGIGLTTYSPLASGVLSGKYNGGAVPEGSRATVPAYQWMRESVLKPEKIATAERLAPIAADLGFSLAQMSLAWLLKNPHVSSVITGASRPEQLIENMKAIEVLPLLNAEILDRINNALETYHEETPED